MLPTIVEQLIAIVATLSTIVTGMAGMTPDQRFGATIPITVAVFPTSLASKITSTATTMTMVTGTDKSGDDLSGYICFAIDEGTASEEFVCGTANATSVTSMIRGIDPVDGDEEVTSLKKSHRRGASVKITNYPQLAILSRIVNGDETLPNKLTYASQPTISSDQDIPDKAYVDGVAIAGASDATQTTKGIVEIATKAELASGSTASTSDTTAWLVPSASYFQASSTATTSAILTNDGGKIDQGFINLTEAWVFYSSLVTASTLQAVGTTSLATTTIGGINGQPGSLEVAGLSDLATTTINDVDLDVVLGGAENDASSYHYHANTVDTGQTSTTTSDGAFTIPHDLGVIPSYVSIDASGICNRDSADTNVCRSIGTASSTVSESSTYYTVESGTANGSGTGQSGGNIICLWDTNNSECGVSATLTTLDASNMIITFSVGDPTVNQTIYLQYSIFK